MIHGLVVAIVMATTGAVGVVLETTVSDPLAWLVNLGVAGIVIVLLVTGQLRTKWEVNALDKRIADQDKVIKEFQDALIGQTLPALARSAQVLEAIPSSERGLQDELHQTRGDMAELISRLERLAKGEG